MQIENHKEEVPFAYYEGLFEKLEPAEAAERTGVKWDGKEFYVNLLGTEYAIAHPKYGIRTVDCHSERPTGVEESVTPNRRISPLGCASVEMTEGVKDIPLQVQTFLLRYLLEAKQVAWGGTWKTFREMPWGEMYIKPYTGRVLTRAAFTFGTRVDKFRAACEKMGGKKLPHGDAGYQFDLIGNYAMQILVWEGDEEFPPNAQVIYTDNFAEGFAAEDRVVAGDMLITAIKANM